MPKPSQVAKRLRKSAKKLARAVEPAVAEAANLGLEEAASIGGSISFGRNRYRMIAEVDTVKSRKGAATITIIGTPAGGWAIKSFGRGPSKSYRGSALNINGEPRSYARSASGDQRWLRVGEAIEAGGAEAIGSITDEAMEV